MDRIKHLPRFTDTVVRQIWETLTVSEQLGQLLLHQIVPQSDCFDKSEDWAKIINLLVQDKLSNSLDPLIESVKINSSPHGQKKSPRLHQQNQLYDRC